MVVSDHESAVLERRPETPMASLVPKYIDDPIDRRVIESFEPVWPLVAAPYGAGSEHGTSDDAEELESSLRVLLGVWDPGTSFSLDPLAIFEQASRGRERGMSMATNLTEESLVIALCSRALGFAWLLQRRLPRSHGAGIRTSLAVLMDLTRELYLIDEFDRALAIYAQLRALLPMGGRSLEEIATFIVDAELGSDSIPGHASHIEAIRGALPSALIQVVTTASEAALALGDLDAAQVFLADAEWVDELDQGADASKDLWNVWYVRSKVSMAAGRLGEALNEAEAAVAMAESSDDRAHATMQLALVKQRENGNFLEFSVIPGVSGTFTDELDTIIRQIDVGRGGSIEVMKGTARSHFETMLERFPEYEREDEYVLAQLLTSVERPEHLLLSEDQRQALERLQSSSGRRGINALVFLLVDARGSQRVRMLHELLSRAKDELPPESTFDLNHKLGRLLLSDDWSSLQEQCLPLYVEWLEHVSWAWETAEARGAADELAYQLTLTVSGFMDTLAQLPLLMQSMPQLSDRLLRLVPRLFRAVLGRPLRVERGWKRLEDHRGGVHGQFLRAMESALARQEWKEFDAERKRFLDSVATQRNVRREALGVPRHSAFPEFLLAGYVPPDGESTFLLRFARFDGRTTHQPLRKIERLPEQIQDVLVKVRASIRRPKREFDMSEVSDGGLSPDFLAEMGLNDLEFERASLEYSLSRLGCYVLDDIEQPLPEVFGVRAVGLLQSVPFAALRMNEAWLGERSLPIVLVGNEDPDELLRPIDIAPSVVVVADPVFVETGSAERRDASGTESRGRLSPLPGTRTEATMISSKFPSAKILMGHDATREGLLSVLYKSPPQILHLATHGISNASNPERSYLALSVDDREEPTLLSFDEIPLLDLSAVRLVVLSACSTMHGRPRLSDGIASLAWAFKAAGADMVVASRWPVVDEAAPKFWESFYDALLRGGDVPRSMLEAQKEMIANSTYGANPAVGAVYQLIA